MAGGLDNGATTNTEFVGRTAGDGHPDNYATETAATNVGVLLQGGHQILSSGGEIFIAGIGSATTTGGDIGVGIKGGLVYSGPGKIHVYGKSPTSCQNDWHRGILTGWNGRSHVISESTAEYATEITQSLKKQGFRVESDLRSEKINYKIREHSLQKVPYILVVGDKERQAGAVAVRGRGGVELGVMLVTQFSTLLSEDVALRRNSGSAATQPA
jgi:hypothetical protein